MSNECVTLKRGANERCFAYGLRTEDTSQFSHSKTYISFARRFCPKLFLQSNNISIFRSIF
ncbi:hypothetical protein ISN45_Aa05g031290 [Arabidopsis thaliana x Arabidopsis arenosa]|uniref:Uncharacterized protein n=4 Tax=Arabidopsis TaxID=3701 RepID=A0A8T2A0A7_ARASU|nr:hypothetical protein ISN45_Aa05g031290 [Arabidopsis thaliana x Arabidopsis arenosa]KAG7566672.1 hypothetical protein ISN44_As10g031980 [Arabidopsis suecica]